jgi:transcriptional regulator with XRE-family HTH domain
MRTRISEIRKRAGVSQSELAQKIGATLSMVGKLERGERGLTLNWLTKIAAALDVSPAMLLDASDEVLQAGTVGPGGVVSSWRRTFIPDDELDQIEESALIHTAERQSIYIKGSPLSVTLPPDTTLIFGSGGSNDLSDCVGRLCVFTVAGAKERQLGYIGSGSTQHAANVLLAGGGLIENVQLSWASPIKDISIP